MPHLRSYDFISMKSRPIASLVLRAFTHQDPSSFAAFLTQISSSQALIQLCIWHSRHSLYPTMTDHIRPKKYQLWQIVAKDGGGALPDVPSVKDEPLRPKEIGAVRERRDAREAAQPEHPKQHGKAPSIALLGTV